MVAVVNQLMEVLIVTGSASDFAGVVNKEIATARLVKRCRGPGGTSCRMRKSSILYAVLIQEIYHGHAVCACDFWISLL